MLKILETNDIDELSAAQEDWEIKHRPVNPSRFQGRLVLGRVGGIRVDLERWNAPLELSGVSPQNGLSFALPLHKSGSYLSGGHEVTANRIDVFPPRSDIFAQIRRQSTLISCTLPGEVLSRLTETPFDWLFAQRETGHSVCLVQSSAVADLRRWWLRLLDLSRREEISPRTQDRLIDETLLITARAFTETLAERQSRPHRSYRLARRARDFMLERQANPPSILDVCVSLNASERTLHKVFRDVYDVSPKRFLKAQRLFAARQALKSSGPENRVSEVALDLGFWDLGRFSREYRTMFGELPSATLHREQEIAMAR